MLSSSCASVDNIVLLKGWLRLNIPEWEPSEVSNVGNYLGSDIAPLSGSCFWKRALNKSLTALTTLPRLGFGV